MSIILPSAYVAFSVTLSGVKQNLLTLLKDYAPQTDGSANKVILKADRFNTGYIYIGDGGLTTSNFGVDLAGNEAANYGPFSQGSAFPIASINVLGSDAAEILHVEIIAA